jgi:hypothetical protein
LFLFGSHEISADDLRRLGSVQAAQELAKQQDVELHVMELAGSSQENDR